MCHKVGDFLEIVYLGRGGALTTNQMPTQPHTVISRPSYLNTNVKGIPTTFFSLFDREGPSCPVFIIHKNESRQKLWSEGFSGCLSITQVGTASVSSDEYLLDIAFDLELNPL